MVGSSETKPEHDRFLSPITDNLGKTTISLYDKLRTPPVDPITAKQQVAAKLQRVVVKVGTRLLTDVSRIPVLIGQAAALRARGVKLIIVSSGAVGLGMKSLSLAKRPGRLSDVQALAAIGQSKLMSPVRERGRPATNSMWRSSC